MFESQSKTFLVKVPVTGVSLNKSEVTLNVGDAETLTAMIEPTYTETTGAGQTVTWSSSDEGVATVKDGVVTGVKAGTAYTGAISGWRSAKAK